MPPMRFTNPEAGNDMTKPTWYSPQTAEAAYGEMRAFFERKFARDASAQVK